MLTEGDYTVSVLGHTTYYFKVKINKVNDYTRQFATKVETIIKSIMVYIPNLIISFLSKRILSFILSPFFINYII